MRTDILIFSKNNSELLSGIKTVNQNEKKLRTDFLCYLAEIDSRKLHLELGYSNLCQYLMEELNHSESESLKRIQVARKMRQLPLLFHAIKDQKLSLTAASRLCRYLNQSNVATLLSECERKSVRQVEKVIVKYFPKAEVPDSIQNQATPLSVDRVHIQFSANKEFTDKLEKAKALLSHEFPEGKLAEIFSAALDALIEKKEPKVKRTRKPVGEAKGRSRYIPRGIQTEVWKRDQGRCCYVSPTGKRCEETRFLEFDHITAFSREGSSTDPKNIRILCSAHNKYLAIKTFGKGWVEAKIRDRRRFSASHHEPLPFGTRLLFKWLAENNEAFEK